MLTITVVVGLLPLVSTTVDAAEVDELPYIMVLEDTRLNLTWVYASSSPIHIISTSRSSGIVDFGVLNGYSLVQLSYNEELATWNTTDVRPFEEITRNYYIYGTSTSYASGTVFWCDTAFENGVFNITTNYELNSSEQSVLAGYSNDMSILPDGIAEELNKQTESGATASQIITDTTATYTSYQNGDITNTEMQQIVTTNLDTLSDLSDNTGNTLSDLMQINNAITYNQTIQEHLDNNVSSDLQTFLKEKIDAATSHFTSYRNGDSSQQSAIHKIRIVSGQVAALVSQYSSTADLQAINTTLGALENLISAVGNYSDVSQESSDKSQASDQAELDYLDELTAETTATVEQIAPSKNFTSTQTGEARQVLDLIWENEFVKRLLPMCAGFMVVCVVLGIRYKV